MGNRVHGWAWVLQIVLVVLAILVVIAVFVGILAILLGSL